MYRDINERSTQPEDTVIDRNDYLVVRKQASLKDRILLSPIVKFVIPTFIAVACLMIGIYVTMYFTLSDSRDIWPATCNIKGSYRVNCFPGKNVTYGECVNADCCWHDGTNLCFHSVPSRHGYTQKSDSDSYQVDEILVPRRASSPFGSKNADSLTLKVENHDENHIEIILKIGQKSTRGKRNIHKLSRISVNSLFNEDTFLKETKTDELSDKLVGFLPKNERRKTVKLENDAQSKMDVYVHNPEFSITVMRKNDTTSNPLLSTARGPLILTKFFWEMTLYITNSSLYGLNQLELNGTTNWIYDNENGTSRLAFLGINEKGEGTTCYVHHEGPMEIEVLDESNLVVLRGISLPDEISIHVFAGSTPLEAIKQLTKATWNESPLVHTDLSSTGLHVCPNVNDEDKDIITSMRESIEAMKNKGTPWDSHCIHQDFNPTMGNSMDDEKIRIIEEAIKLLTLENVSESEQRTLVPHLSPMLYNNSLAWKLADLSLLLRNVSGNYVGYYRKERVFYPDWHDKSVHNESYNYLKDYMKNYGNPKLLYLRDSWPRDDTKGNPSPPSYAFDYLPPSLRDIMANGTVPYDLSTDARSKSHYNEHAAYSSDFRDFVKSLFPSHVIKGLWGESGYSSWSALRAAISSGIGSSIIGQLPPPMYACGSGLELGPGDASDELCSRWFGAAVAWPHIVAIHENLPGGSHLTETSTSYVNDHLKLRGSLVTYANTIIAQYQRDGSPILAPIAVHYPNDLQARYRSNQFMWGNDILVGLVTLPKVSQVPMWIPGKYPWRHLNGGETVYPTTMDVKWIDAVESHIVTLIRPGSIIPIHKIIAMTSASTLISDITLVINLSSENFEGIANGTIFYASSVNQGEFLIVTVNEKTLRIENILKTKKIACSNDETILKRQATMIKDVQILGKDNVYEVSVDFCTIDIDTFERELK